MLIWVFVWFAVKQQQIGEDFWALSPAQRRTVAKVSDVSEIYEMSSFTALFSLTIPQDCSHDVICVILMWCGFSFPIAQVWLEGGKNVQHQPCRNILSPKALPSLIMGRWCVRNQNNIVFGRKQSTFVRLSNNEPNDSFFWGGCIKDKWGINLNPWNWINRESAWPKINRKGSASLKHEKEAKRKSGLDSKQVNLEEWSQKKEPTYSRKKPTQCLLFVGRTISAPSLASFSV